MSQEGKNLTDIQEMNRSLVLRLLKKHAICSRADLARLSGLNQATITNIIHDFLAWGLVKETGLIGGKRGRRSIGIQINQKEYYIIGVRLSRTQFKLGLFDLFGNILVKRVFPHTCADPQKVIEKMQMEIGRMIEESDKGKRILGIGIAVPGPYFRQEGKIMAITDFDGWDDIPFRKIMSESFDLPVIIDHDANAAVLAEWWGTPNKHLRGTAIFLIVDEGVGAGIINNGKLFRGDLGTAGEVGHMSIDRNGDVCKCGNRGCLVNYASNMFMMKAAAREMERCPGCLLKPGFSLEDLVRSYQKQDPPAVRALQEWALNLSIGIINIMNAYGANEIIVYIWPRELSDDLLQSVQGYIRGHTLQPFIDRVRIRPPSFEEDPVFIGSGMLAIDYCLGKTSIFENESS